MKNLSPSRISRRRFLAATSLAVAAPTLVPSSVFGADAPSNRITMGVAGWGMQGPGNTGNFMGQPDCQVIATCNTDKNHLQHGQEPPASVRQRHQRPLQKPGLQSLPRLPRDDGAEGH